MHGESKETLPKTSIWLSSGRCTPALESTGECFASPSHQNPVATATRCPVRRIAPGLAQEVARDVLGEELVIGHVAVEGPNHVIA